MRKIFRTIERRDSFAGFLFVSPFIIGFVAFFAYPIAQSIFLIFHNSKYAAGKLESEFVGLANLRYIFFEEPHVNRMLWTSISGLLPQIAVVLIASIFLSLIINQKFKGRTFVRAVFFLPVIVTSGVVMSIIKGDAFAASLIETSTSSTAAPSFGLQQILVQSGLDSSLVDFFTGISNNLFDVLWRTGIQTVIFLAGLQSIPKSLYEASSVEGASAWENFWMITLPMLTPMIMLNLVYTVVDFFTDSTNEVMMLATEYGTGSSQNYGVMSAISWVYFSIIGLILMLIALIYTQVQKRDGRPD